MKYRILAAIVLVWTAALVQSTLLEHIEIFNIRPNLMIVLMVIVALLRNPVESATMAIFFGLSLDILMGKNMGWNALLFFLVSIPISLINEKIYREKLLVLLSLAFGVTIIIETSFFLITFLFRDYTYLPYIFSTLILPEAIYNSILILPLFKPVSAVYTILDKVDRRRNRISA